MRTTTLVLFLFLSIFEIGAQSLDSLLAAAKYRNIGPFRGGRSVCASGVIGDQLTYYMGTTGGGLWKTNDAGQMWSNISDGYFRTGSVGAIAISESNPNILFCGMGEHAPRGVMTSHGDGVYKSIDAGKTWKHIGLEKTQHISRIVIHPTNPNIVYVAAQGALYGPTKERGIYKSTDGGENWENVLFVNDLTGCSELSMDINFPHIMYATMWHHQRKPWKVISGGEGSGVYKSVDGGDSWEKIEKGLPSELGKMAIAVCRSNSNKVYALVESDSNKDLGGLFVSNNAGESWSKISGDNRLTQRAWYYIEVFADPNDENTVYVLSAPALRSIDGGKTWERLSGTHGDFHDLWINPDNSKNMVIANDGGAAISHNFGKSWSTQSNMPTAQFYRVSADNMFPYHIYGGQQDNTSVSIPTLSLGRGGIDTQDWTYSAGGESAFVAFDPDNPRYQLGGSYLGTIEVLDTEAKAGTNIMAAPIQYLGRDAKDMKYRYNWNAPIIRSVHEENTFFHGAQLLLRTRDMGKTWEEVSPDLTKNEEEKQGKGGGPYTNEAVGAENYGTLSYVAESPHEMGVIWTCSDDGLVQLTRDNCKSWKDVTPKGLEECLINAIDLSPHDPATAYIATTRYKFNDHTPALYKTTDYGNSWTNITNGIPNGAFTRVIREDNVQKGLLFAGTETGVYISWNDGKSWESFQLNLPITPITDLLVHQNNLIVATSGRSFWIFDDLDLIRQYSKEIAKAKLYDPTDPIEGIWYSEMSYSSANFKGTHPFRGINPAHGLVVYYDLPEISDSAHVKMNIYDSNGFLMRSLSSKGDKSYQSYDGGPPAPSTIGKKEGLNRFVWDLRHETLPGIPKAYIEGSYRGHRAAPGDYKMELLVGDDKLTTDFKILPNPIYNITDQEREEYHQFMKMAESEITIMHDMVNRVYKMRNQLKSIIEELPDDQVQLNKEAKDLLEKMTSWDEDMVQRKSKAYDDVENFPNKFTANYLFMINMTESSIPKVNEASKERYDELMLEWTELKKRGLQIENSDIPGFNKKLWDAGIGAIKMGKQRSRS